MKINYQNKNYEAAFAEFDKGDDLLGWKLFNQGNIKQTSMRI